MKFSISRNLLLAALKEVGPAVHHKPVLPVLEYVHIELSDAWLILSATNLEIGVKTRILAIPDENGAICLPYKVFADLVNSFTKEQISVDADLKLNRATVKCGKAKATIAGLPAEEFPPVPAIEAQEVIAPDLAEINKKLAFSASTEDAKPSLCGVHFSSVNGKLSAYSTDGYRISILDTNYDFKGKAIIPTKGIQKSSELTKPTMRIGNNRLIVADEDSVVITSLIEGTSPDFRAILPRYSNTKITVSSQELLQAIKQASIMTENTMVMFASKKQDDQDGLFITSQSEEAGNFESWIPAKLEGPEASIFALNNQFLEGAIKTAGTPEIQLGFNKSNSPISLKGIGLDNWTHVIMPMSVK